MNILFDGRIFKLAYKNNASRTGIFWVAINLLKELNNRSDVNIQLYIPDTNDICDEELPNILGLKDINILNDNDDFSVINAFLSPYEAPPDIIKSYPLISCYVVLYDIIPMLYPEYFTPPHRKFFLEFLEQLSSDEYYFAISDNTRNDYIKYYSKVLPQNIFTIPLSTNLVYKPNKDSERLKYLYEKYNIPKDKKYLFSLCSLEPRKNLIRSVRTFIEFINKNNIEDMVYILGGQAWDYFIEKLEKECPNYKKYENKIIHAGYVDDEDLEVLYSNAQWFIYTSQYEGFGMPPLEAMSCGCPVITSNNSSLPEVVGDSAIKIDWDSDEQHIEAYEKYYFDENYKNVMAQKGFEHSKLFSWKNTVDIILNKMYEIEQKKLNKPKVTVITATYNLIKNGRKDWFIQNMESVQSQTYNNIEHIIIDGNSDDGTIDLLEEYKQKGLIDYYSEQDKGIYDAINKGILKAKGKYVVCLNSDDFYCDEHSIEWLVSKAEENNADACYGNAKRLNPETLEFMSEWNGKKSFYPLIGSMPCHQTLMIKTDVMKELGLYNIDYKVSADNVFMCKMLKHNKFFVGIDKNIISFRDGGFSNSHIELSVKDRIYGTWIDYGQYKKLTPSDLDYFFGHKYLTLPLDEALKLGAKLIECGNPDWIVEYYRLLVDYNLKNIEVKNNEKFIHKIFSMKNQYKNGKKRKIITVLGVKISINVTR